jgi:hypothetical protein
MAYVPPHRRGTAAAHGQESAAAAIPAPDEGDPDMAIGAGVETTVNALQRALLSLYGSDDAVAAETAIVNFGGGEPAVGINVQASAPPIARFNSLIFAAHFARPAIMRVLCEHGGDVNARCLAPKANAAVHYAAGHLPAGNRPFDEVDESRAACVEVLARFECDVNALTGDGKNYTALHKALYLRLHRTALALVRAGGSLAHTNKYGETPEAAYRAACRKQGMVVDEEFLEELRSAAAAAESIGVDAAAASP